MKPLPLANPFGAPVFHAETVSSTMDEARRLAARGGAHGTVITADFQEAGRGRLPGRPWQAEAGKNLFFTILLRYPDFSALPAAVTLKTGLALALAVEDFAPALRGAVQVKWPNDLMLIHPPAGTARKAAGILTEGDGSTVYIGIGVNVSQTVFPAPLQPKATSIALALAAAGSAPVDNRFSLLERILARLHDELAGGGPEKPWRERLGERLYLRGRQVRFIAGAAGSGQAVEGRLEGIGGAGELLLRLPGEDRPRAFVTGELEVYVMPCLKTGSGVYSRILYSKELK